MARLQYDFDRRPLDGRRSGGGKKWLRPLLVFCAVAAVTIAVVAALIPSKKQPVPKETTEQNGSAAGSAAENTSPISGGNRENSISDVPAGNSGGSDVSGGTYSTTQTETVEVPGGTAVQPDKGSKESGEKFVKGVAGSSDIPEAADKATYKNPGLPHSLSEVELLEKMVNPAEAGEKARAFLSREAAAGGVNSEYWARAGRVLANSVRESDKKSRLKDYAENYKVVSGDALARIARRKNTTVEGIKWVNKRKSNFLRIGERLKIIPGPWKITVSRSARILNLWQKRDGVWKIFSVYDVGVGRIAKATPAGNFVISFSLKDPVQYGSENQQIPHGDPKNQLGDYFLKLAPAGKKSAPLKGYGIHGSQNDASIGRSLSNGCIRMRNGDVKVLYYLLPKNTPVEISD